MAGRGCSIVIEVLGGSSSNDSVEELRLPVALHSPLEVLKEQLEQLVGISMESQVLILLDLTDPERNHDLLLIGRDHESLRNCGIKNGSVLTLHALGLTAERKQKLTKDAINKKIPLVNTTTEKIYSLITPIGPKEADHSFNGVIFDVMCKGPFEVDVTSISIGGMLGRVRIFYRNRPWEAGKPERVSSHHWWAHRDSLSRENWSLLADIHCSPSWDRSFEIPFNRPVTLLPNSINAFYCHSSLPDDLGIQYQTYRKDDIIAEDDHISIHPGVGHTGSEPFDETNGWYRSYRGLSGIVNYKCRIKGWTITSHKLFPKVLKKSIIQMLLCNNYKFKVVIDNNEKDVDSYESKSIYDTEIKIVKNTNVSIKLSDKPVKCQNNKAMTIASLPVFLIYNILEYMHWDWFEDTYPLRYFAVTKRTIGRYLLWKEKSATVDPINALIDNGNDNETANDDTESITQARTLASRAYTSAIALRNPASMLFSYLSSAATSYGYDPTFYDMDDNDEDSEYIEESDDNEEDNEGNYLDSVIPSANDVDDNVDEDVDDNNHESHPYFANFVASDSEEIDTGSDEDDDSSDDTSSSDESSNNSTMDSCD